MMKDEDSNYRFRSQILWGLVLVGIGAIFMFDVLDAFEIRQIWRYLPILMVAFGIHQMLSSPAEKHFANGLWQVFLGIWLFVMFNHLFGMNWRNGWPFLLIAGGIVMVVRPIVVRIANKETGK
jgi:hypothetical protein